MQQQLTLTYTKYPDISGLPHSDQDLVKKALEATILSYAPYSNFKVGAAARLSDGQILTGSNQENASYGVTLCAERALLATVSTLAPTKHIETIAINYVTETNHSDHPISPCGICRQALLEHQNQHNCITRIIMAGETGEIWVIEDARTLLPLAFSSASLKSKLIIL